MLLLLFFSSSRNTEYTIWYCPTCSKYVKRNISYLHFRVSRYFYFKCFNNLYYSILLIDFIVRCLCYTFYDKFYWLLMILLINYFWHGLNTCLSLQLCIYYFVVYTGCPKNKQPRALIAPSIWSLLQIIMHDIFINIQSIIN